MENKNKQNAGINIINENYNKAPIKSKSLEDIINKDDIQYFLLLFIIIN